MGSPYCRPQPDVRKSLSHTDLDCGRILTWHWTQPVARSVGENQDIGNKWEPHSGCKRLSKTMSCLQIRTELDIMSQIGFADLTTWSPWTGQCGMICTTFNLLHENNFGLHPVKIPDKNPTILKYFVCYRMDLRDAVYTRTEVASHTKHISNAMAFLTRWTVSSHHFDSGRNYP